jgi:hypothetical protein
MHKSAISSSKRKNGKKILFFGILNIGSCPRLLGEHAQKVERKVFFLCARQGQQTLTARGAKVLNSATLSFCTIIMYIMLGTCVANLRGR